MRLLHKAGFTMVEMLVYIAILLVVSTAGVTLLISFDDFIGQYKIETALYRSGTTAMEQILVALRQGDLYDIINSTEDDPANGALAIVNGATTTRFALEGNDLVLYINGQNFGDLIGDTASATSFPVHHYDMAAGDLVRVEFGLEATDNGVTKTLILNGGAVIRGSL